MMRSKRLRAVSLRVALALIAAAGLVLASRRYIGKHSELQIPTATARAGVFSVLIHCRGELVARRSVQLTSPTDVTDLQIVWLAPAGSRVKKGDPVIRFDPSRLQQDLKEKTAALQQAQATLDQTVAQARVTVDQDELDLSKAKYAAEKARLETSKQRIVSAIEGEKSAIDLRLAEEKYRLQEAAGETHKASDRAKTASQTRLRDEAKMEVQRTKLHLSEMEMISPLDGVVTYLPNYAQGWMNAAPFRVGDHTSSGQALAEIPDLSSLEMENKVDEVDRGRIALGDSVLVHVDAFPEKTYQAKLVAISPLSEQSFNEWPPARSFRAYAQTIDKEGRLRPGMNAGADIIEARLENAVSVPAKALFTAHGRPVVYVKDRDVYRQTPVQVSARNPDEVALSGLRDGTVVALVEPEKSKH